MKSIQPRSKGTLFSFALLPLVAIFAMLFAPTANATHYRGGAASYTIAANGVVTVTVYTAWRADYNFDTTPAFSAYTGPGSTGTNLGAFTLATQAYTFATGTELGGALFRVERDTFTFNLTGRPAGIHYARWTNGNWVPLINNMPEDFWALELKIAYTPGVASAGPTMIPATIDIIGRGYPYTQNLNSVDPDGTPVTYQNLVGYVQPDLAPSSLIPGISVSPTGTISIPAVNTTAMALGRWSYKVRVTDGSGGTAIRDVLVVAADPIAGNANQPPVLANIGPKTIDVNNTLSFNVSASDPDIGQTLTVRAQLLPPGATFSEASGPASGTFSAFSWTPTNGQQGTYQVNFEVYDSAAVTLIDSEEVTITVGGGNTPPELATVGNKSVANLTNLSFNLSATDVDGHSVTYQMFGGPPGATLSSGGAFSWTPNAGQSNFAFPGITFRATDNGAPNLFDEETITITVGTGNHPPVTSATLTHEVDAGDLISFLVSGSDVDAGQTLTLSANAGLPAGATFATVSGPSSTGVDSTFSWTPTVADGGTVQVKFLTQDNGAQVLNHEITVTIKVNAVGPVRSSTLGDVVSGNDAPNSNGTSDGTQFDMLTRGGFIAQNGHLAFPGELTGPGVDGTNFKGVWKHNGTLLSRLTRTGDNAPETGATAAKFSDLPLIPGINDAGQVTLFAALATNPGSTPPTTIDNDTGLWSELGGTGFQILMREGDDIPTQVPPLPAGTKLGAFGSGCFATADTGGGTAQAAFTAKFKGGSTDTALLRASILNDTVTAVGVVARENASAPGTGETFGFLNSTYTGAVRMDAQGNIVFGAALKPSNKSSIWYQPVAGGAPTAAVVAGNAAPGTTATFAAVDVPVMGGSGTFAFRGVLNRVGDNTANDKNDGIWRGTATGPFTNILRRGDSNTNRPGLFTGAILTANPNIKAGNIWSGWLTNANRGAWLGWVDLGGNGISAYPADTFGIYTDLSGTMTLLISSGDPAPGIAGASLFFVDHPVVGGVEQLAFIGTVTGGGTTAGVNDKGIWRTAPNGGAPSLVVRTGDSMTTTQGVKTIADVDFPGSGLLDHHWETPVMDGTGRMIVYVTFTDGTTSQVLAP